VNTDAVDAAFERAAALAWQEYFLPCCGGWHYSHLRARIGSYHHWLLERLRELSQ